MNIRPATAADSLRISELLTGSWGSHIAVAHGVAYDATTLPAIVAEKDDRIVGHDELVLELLIGQHRHHQPLSRPSRTARVMAIDAEPLA